MSGGAPISVGICTSLARSTPTIFHKSESINANAKITANGLSDFDSNSLSNGRRSSRALM